MQNDTIQKQTAIFEQIKDTCSSFAEARRISFHLSVKSDKEIQAFIEKRKQHVKKFGNS